MSKLIWFERKIGTVWLNNYQRDIDKEVQFSWRTVSQCVAVGRRISILQWRHNAAWTTWCAAADTDTVDGFLPLREFTASEPPSIMTIIESQEPGREWMICCGLRHHYELIYADGASQSLHLEATVKPHLVAALDLCEDEEPELLLCYNSEQNMIFQN